MGSTIVGALRTEVNGGFNTGLQHGAQHGGFERSRPHVLDLLIESMKEYSGAMAVIEQAVGMMTGAIKSGAPARDVIAILRQYHEALGQEMPEWCTEEFVARVRERMRQIQGRWKATAYGKAMEIAWHS